jgi:ribosomal protein S18 acetylase RimI-like enzyme
MTSIPVQYRAANVSDAPAVAALHAASWQRHYRGAYSDAFLDGDVEADRLRVWTSRLHHRDEDSFTIVAEYAGSLAGFVHTVLDADPVWGALVDNLHVAHGLQRGGLGTRLMGEAAQTVTEHRPGASLYLWVLAQNVAAQAFYHAKGGVCVDRELVQAPGGDPAQLNGAPLKLRYAWSDPSILLGPTGRRGTLLPQSPGEIEFP